MINLNFLTEIAKVYAQYVKRIILFTRKLIIDGYFLARVCLEMEVLAELYIEVGRTVS